MIEWRYPIEHTNYNSSDWIKKNAKIHAFNKKGISLCKKYKRSSPFEKYELNDETLGLLCKKCFKKWRKEVKYNGNKI